MFQQVQLIGNLGQDPEMKTCTRCEESKPVSEFAKSKRTKDGLRPECRSCRNKDERTRYMTLSPQEKSKHYLAHREERKEGFRKYAQLNPRNMPYNPERAPARIAVYRAIKKGKLIRPDACQRCGKQCRPDAHHHKGYDKENRLDVVWMCKECHSLSDHPEFQRILEETQCISKST